MRSFRALSAARVKRWLKPAGWVFVVLALALVAHRLFMGGGAALLVSRPAALWTALAAAVAYAAAFNCFMLNSRPLLSTASR